MDTPRERAHAFTAHKESYTLPMYSLVALAAPLALILPMAAGGVAASGVGARGGTAVGSGFAQVGAAQCDAATLQGQAETARVNPLSVLRRSSIARQVRIEHRVIVRITPQSSAPRQNLLADIPQRELPPRFEERDKEKCVALDRIAGVQTGSGNRLVLFLRDQRMISVNLEKSCRARDFYSGFYVERHKDGRLCMDRDKLQSRTGARCEVEMMRQLVEARG